MAKKTTKKKPTKARPKAKAKKRSYKLSSQQKLIFGSLLIILGVLLFVSFLSFIFTGKEDQSVLSNFPERSEEYKNWAFSHLTINMARKYRWRFNSSGYNTSFKFIDNRCRYCV